MNKIIKHIALLSILLIAPPSFANLITNGNFATSCNLDDWDQYGDVSISGSANNCTAQLNIDDSDEAFEAELSQELSLTIGKDYTLSVDFSFITESANAEYDDLFFISLFNLDNDFIDLSTTDIFGTGRSSESLIISADELANYDDQNWSLSLFLFNDNYDDTTSTVSISNLSLTEIITNVPEPSSIAIFALGLAGLIKRRKFANELIRKSHIK